jgi:hypothetical protein
MLKLFSGSRHNYDRDVPRLGVCQDLVSKREAVQQRQTDVEQHKIGRLVLQTLKRRESVSGLLDPIACEGERPREDLTKINVILDDQDRLLPPWQVREGHGESL